jgi:hypothetical protein
MAYGINAPFGLRPTASINGGSWNEKYNEYYVYASADGQTTYGLSLYYGDPVIWNRATATVTASYPTVARFRDTTDPASVNDITAQTISVLGVFAGCQYYDINNNPVTRTNWAGGTRVYPGSVIKIQVIDDPNTIFEIQASTSTNVLNNARFGATGGNAPATLAYFGQNYGFGLAGGGANLVPNNPATGNPNSGLSAFYLNVVGTNTVRDAETLPLKAIAYSQNVSNNIYDSTGIVNPFLNIIVSLNNHVYKPGTTGTTPA